MSNRDAGINRARKKLGKPPRVTEAPIPSKPVDDGFARVSSESEFVKIANAAYLKIVKHPRYGLVVKNQAGDVVGKFQAGFGFFKKSLMDPGKVTEAPQVVTPKGKVNANTQLGPQASAKDITRSALAAQGITTGEDPKSGAITAPKTNNPNSMKMALSKIQQKSRDKIKPAVVLQSGESHEPAMQEQEDGQEDGYSSWLSQIEDKLGTYGIEPKDRVKAVGIAEKAQVIDYKRDRGHDKNDLAKAVGIFHQELAKGNPRAQQALQQGDIAKETEFNVNDADEEMVDGGGQELAQEPQQQQQVQFESKTELALWKRYAGIK